MTDPSPDSPTEYGAAYLDWLRSEEAAGAPLIPAATVVLLRDTSDGIETLLLRRNTAVEFAGGLWVFPGGRIDPEDHVEGGDLITAARNASVPTPTTNRLRYGMLAKVLAQNVAQSNRQTPKPISPLRRLRQLNNQTALHTARAPKRYNECCSCRP